MVRVLRLLIPALFIAYGVVVCRNASFGIGGSDSSGYFNTARMLTEGRTSRPVAVPPELHVRDLNAFVPIGFMRKPDSAVILPFYPIGFPLHLAAAALIGGWRSAPYYVSPLAMLAVVILTYLLARRFTLRVTSLIAAAVMAFCPVLIFQGLQPMSDVTATAWCTAAFLLATYDRPRFALFSGAALGMAVLVRPTSLLMLPALALLIRPRNYRWTAGGGLPFAIVLAAYNWSTFGSPLASGYSEIGLLHALHAAGIQERAGFYIDQTARQFGPFALIAWLAALSPARPRVALAAWFLAFFAFYSCYDIYGAWWYTRFILPAYPGLIVLVAIFAEHLFQRRTLWARATAVGIGAITLAFALAGVRKFEVFTIDDGQFQLLRAARWMAKEIPPGSIIVTSEASGLTLYHTKNYPLRWEYVTSDELHEYIDTAAAHGRGSWAVLISEEVPKVEKLYGPLTQKVVDAPGPFLVFRLK